MNGAEELLGPALARGQAGDPAILFHDETVTYGDLDARASRVAGALTALGLRPDDRIVVLVHDRPQFFDVYLGAMKAGAVDFVEKPYEKQTLVEALNRAFQRLEERTQRDLLVDQAKGRVERLTPREHEVLVGLVEGQTNKSIADDLNISPRTVEIHRANLMEKLGATSLSAVLRIAFAAGIGFEDSDRG